MSCINLINDSKDYFKHINFNKKTKIKRTMEKLNNTAVPTEQDVHFLQQFEAQEAAIL